MDNTKYYIWLSLMRRLSPLHRRHLLAFFESPEGVYGASREKLMEAASGDPAFASLKAESLESLENKSLIMAKAIEDDCKRKGIEIIPLGSPLYPEALRDIPDPPTVLYAIGDTSLLSMQAIAVVGTRRSSPYGRWVAAEIGRKIGACGTVVVSGMAEGIDSCAHRGCLEAHGKTIAVFGTGVDVCFPGSNRGLYREIASKGLLISEYVPGEQGFPGHFPERNRIISGLSSKVIVVEGAAKSGSLITAGLAADQGREVWAVPGNINQPNSVGVNRLISDGALPVISLDGLEDALGLISAKREKALEKMSDEEKKVYRFILENPGYNCEQLALRTGKTVIDITPLVTAMELKGLLRRDGSRLFIR